MFRPKPFFKIEFRRIDKKIHMDVDLTQKDNTGYFMAVGDKEAIKIHLYNLLKHLDKLHLMSMCSFRWEICSSCIRF